MESNFSLLDVAAVMRGYRSAKRRVIFLDYGGTICTTPKRSIAYYAHANKVRCCVCLPPFVLAPAGLHASPCNVGHVTRGHTTGVRSPTVLCFFSM